MLYDINTYIGQEILRAQREKAIRENAGRTARSVATYTTTGIGEIRLPKPMPLKLTFVEEPIFTYGAVLDKSTHPIDGHFPRAGCLVYDWHTDKNGYYLGAYLIFTVDTLGPGAVLGVEPNYTIHHQLCFEGRALKNVPAHLLDL